MRKSVIWGLGFLLVLLLFVESNKSVSFASEISDDSLLASGAITITKDTEMLEKEEKTLSVGTPYEINIEDEAAPLADFKEDKFSWWWIAVIVVTGTVGGEAYRRYYMSKNNK